MLVAILSEFMRGQLLKILKYSFLGDLCYLCGIFCIWGQDTIAKMQ